MSTRFRVWGFRTFGVGGGWRGGGGGGPLKGKGLGLRG